MPRKRGHVQQQHLPGSLRGTGQNVGLHCRAQRHHFVGIQLDVRLLAARGEMKEIVHESAHCGNPRGPAHQHDFVNLFRRDAGVGESLFAGAGGAIEHRLDEQLEDPARNLALVTVAVGQLDIEVRRRLRGKADLGLDSGFAQGLHRAGMTAQIDPMFGVNLIQSDGQKEVVDVVAAQVRVPVGGLHLEDAVAQLEDGDVKGASAEIVHGDGAFFGAIKPVGQRRRGGLVDQTKHFKSGHAARVFGGLALRIVEVGGHGDHRLRDRGAKKALGIALELAQNVRRNFGRRKTKLAQLDARNFTRFDVGG